MKYIKAWRCDNLNEALILNMGQTVVISMLVYLLQRKQKKRDELVNKRTENRKKESLLLLEMNMACARLAYAVAVAIKNKRTNGEVAEGIEAYEQAKEKYFTFLNEQAKDSLER